MDVKKILLYIGVPILGIGIIVGVVLGLRAINQVPDSGAPVATVSTSSSSPIRSFGSGKGNIGKPVTLTPAEQKILDENSAAIKAQTANYQDTWTPEYRAKMEAQQATTTKIIENP